MKVHERLRWIRGAAQAVLVLVMTLLMALPALAAGREVIDDAGDVVALSQPAQRVVTLAPHAAELVAAAGGLPALIGVSQGRILCIFKHRTIE